jgi:Ca2+-binding RTX toxin-like protein
VALRRLTRHAHADHVGAGDNTLTGKNGNDMFVFGPVFGEDAITDFSRGSDHIKFEGGMLATFAALQAASHQVGANTVISIDPDHSITLQNVALTSLHAADFLFA